ATLAVLGMLYTFYTNWSAWTMGAATLPGIRLYVDMWVALAWVLVALAAAYAFQQSRIGLALRASREDEFAARAAGISIWRERLVAFVVSAFFMGLGRALPAPFLCAIAVTDFWLSLTLVSTAMLIVGGQRSLTGAIVGTAFVSAIVEILRQFEMGVSVGGVILQVPLGARELGIAIVMLLILVFRPAGITG